MGWLAAAATDDEEDAGRFAWIPAPLAPRTEALPTWLSRLARRFLSRVRVRVRARARATATARARVRVGVSVRLAWPGAS